MYLPRVLAVMAKRPAPGQTKTRLTPPLTAHQAVALYACLLLDTLDLMGQVEGVTPLLAYAPDDAEGFFRALAPPSFAFQPQQGVDLGRRLNHVTTHALAHGAQQVVVMDSDSPTLPVTFLRRAFACLDDPAIDVVLGPCDDGGYYLIGLKQPCPTLFDVRMSTPCVLRDTLARCAAAGRQAALLPTWYDVDTADEVARLRAELAADPAAHAPRTRAWLLNTVSVGEG